MTATGSTSERISAGTILAFAAQGFFSAAMGLMVAVHLPKFYTDVVLLPAGLLAIGVAVARAFDAIIDPIMGWLSDRTSSRWGRRKPWILLGVIGNAIVFQLLFRPPESAGGAVGTWFAGWFVASFLFVTIVTIPRAALAMELTLDTHERQKLYGAIALFVAFGLVVAAVSPTVLAKRGIVEPRAVMSTLAMIFGIGYVVAHAFMLLVVRERSEFAGRGANPFVPGLRRALRYRPFLIMFVSHVITAVPIAIPATLMPYTVTYVMKSAEPAKWIGYLLLAYLVSGFLTLPFWVAIARRFGKLRVWYIMSFVGVSGGAAWFFIGPGDERLALALQAYVGMQAGVWLFLGGAMHADVVDYDELHTGRRREAQFAAFWAVIPKFALIPGASVPIAILASSGYVPNVAQSPEVIMTLRVLFALVPAAFNAVGLSIMVLYPLTEAVHRAIREGVAGHARGESATDPLTGRSLLPPSRDAADDALAWRLDNFSKKELEHVAEHGPRALPARIIAWAGGCAVASIGTAVLAAIEVTTIEKDPGAGPALAIVAAGLLLAGAAFHALRVGPAIALSRDVVAVERIREHLGRIAA